jgi:hypothetical protein
MEMEAPRIPFTQRYHAVQHGGIARAANSVTTCHSPATADAPPCATARRGGLRASNGDYAMTYVDVDKDRNTYNSSRADLRIPRGATISYARLYWGGNLRVGEQKSAKDNRRVLFAEPGGQYKQIIADTVIGHRDADGVDAYSASADVTRLVRWAEPGAYTVGQLNVAGGNSGGGAWGGWTLVVAYSHPKAPLRDLAIWDGFETYGPDQPVGGAELGRLRIRPGASGSLGVVAYDGDRGEGSNSLAVRADSRPPVALSDAANPVDDAMNSTIADNGRLVLRRQPAHANTLGYDSDVFDLRQALTGGASRLAVRFATEGEGYHVGALFLQADARR